MRLFLIVAATIILAGCRNASGDRFDLICDRTAVTMGSNGSRPTAGPTTRYSINLKDGFWCDKAGCPIAVDRSPIPSVGETSIILANTSTHFLTVDRQSGKLAEVISNGGPDGMTITGRCRKAPYTAPATNLF